MIGETLGPYRLESELGSGGMGTVYLATSDDGCRVAVKVVHPQLTVSDDFAKRFEREAKIGMAIDHANVVRTIDVAQSDGCHYLVMEYVEGQTLEQLTEDLERLPEQLCVHVGAEVCKALAALHAAGAIHRDIKPANVMITPDHVVKVMDLGVARLVDESTRLSQTGAFVGSLDYAAPEQFRGGGKDLDHRVDLHALGLLLYEAATGLRPFDADDVPALIRQVIDHVPMAVGKHNPQLSAFFEQVVATLLEKEREKRFDAADELLRVLEAGETSDWWHERAKALRAATKKPLRRVRIPRETAVYGREDDLSTLREAYDKATAGDGQLVLLEGEAGIGKSRLIDELMRRLEMDGEEVNFLYGSYPPGGAATATGAFSTAYREQFGNAGCASYLTETPLLAPAFDALLRGDAPPEDAQPLTSDSLKTVFVHATRALGRERTTVIVIEDLHFAPEEGRALFASLAMAVPGHRVLLVGTARPGLPTDWTANLTRLDHVGHSEVRRLGTAYVSRMLGPVVGESPLAERVASSIAQKADGNPFFLFEIVRSLRESGVLSRTEDGAWTTTSQVAEVEIPETVQSLFDARIGRLTEEERELLECAACWGFDFDGRLVAAALGERMLPVLRTFGRLEHDHGLVRASGDRFAFDHHAVQEHLYARMSVVVRQELHAALADALEMSTKAADKDPETLDGALCVDLCEHYLRGARGETALRYLEAAQDHLTTGYLHAQAAALGERALAVPGLLTRADRAEALLRLAEALDPMGRRARQEEAAREAESLAEQASDAALRGNAARALGTVLWRTARHEEAEAAFRRALEVARAEDDKGAETRAMGNLGHVLFSQGRLPEANEHYDRVLALSRESGYREGEALATGHLGTVFFSQRRFPQAREHFERSLALCREIQHRDGEAAATLGLGVVFFGQGRIPEAKEHYERSLAISREIGEREGEALATGNLGTVFCAQGRVPEARGHHERHLALCREIGDRRGEAIATGNLGGVFYALGRLPNAKEHHERSLAISREIGDREGEADALGNLGSVHREEGEPARAEERLVSSLTLCEEIGDRQLEAATHLVLGSLRAASGDGAGGRASLEAARDLAAEIGVPGYETLARCELALLPRGDADDALTAFTEHEERLDAETRRGARWLLFRATGDRAHLEEAKRLLDRALSTVPEEFHDSMLTNLRVNREIMAAWEEHRA